MAVIATVVLVNIAGILVIAVRESQNSATAVTWIVVCTILPLLGVVVYAIMSHPVPARRDLRWCEPVQFPQQNCMTKTDGTSLTRELRQGLADVGSPVELGEVGIYCSGDAFYQQLLEDIHAAENSIDVEFYIFRWDEVGEIIVGALIEQALRGVRVRFLRDGLGTLFFPRQATIRLLAAGIDVRVFFPIHLPFLGKTFNHRDHCKIVVIDHNIAYLGGMNVGLEYTGRKRNVGPWRDTQVRICGRPTMQAQRVFESDWSVSTPTSTGLRQARLPEPVSDPHRTLTTQGALDHAARQPDGPVQGPYATALQFLDSGPDNHRATIRDAFFLCLTCAKATIDITTPYFIPGEDIVRALKTAAARGVRVRLLLPANVDHRLIGLACQTYFKDLLQSGIHLFLWQRGVLHAKVMIIDNTVSVVGAANYDLRSFLLNYEVCMIGYGSALADALSSQFERDLEHASSLTLADVNCISMGRRTLHRVAHLFTPLL